MAITYYCTSREKSREGKRRKAVRVIERRRGEEEEEEEQDPRYVISHGEGASVRALSKQ